MSTEIKYYTNTGSEVTQAQAQQLDYYGKTTFLNSNKVKSELYTDENYISTNYIISNLSEINSILAANTEEFVSFEINSLHSGFEKKERKTYKNSVLVGHRILVFDSSNNMICHKYYELDQGVMVKTMLEKFYYNSNGECKYSFEYNSDSTCLIINDLENPQSDIFAWSIGTPEETFTWAGLEYYEFSEPTVPTI